MVLQVAASFDTSTWYAVAYAVSQLSTTLLTLAVPPRSTYIHCGSLYALSHRVVVRPSRAAAGPLAPWDEDAFTGRYSAMFGLPPPVPPVGEVVGDGVGDVVVPPPLVCTTNSHSEYPYPVARAVPYIRTYRPVPLALMVCVPPV